MSLANLRQEVTVMMRLHPCAVNNTCPSCMQSYAQIIKASNVMATTLWYREEVPTVQAQSSWLQRSVRALAKHKKSVLAGAAAGLAVGAGLWMTR